jgi:hypothetical protein
MSQRSEFIKAVIVLFSVAIIAACSAAIPLPMADTRINDLAVKMGQDCFGGAGNIAADANSMKSLLDEIYQGQSIPQTKEGDLKKIVDGYGVDDWVEGQSLAGAIVAKPIAASLAKFKVALTWPNIMEVYTDRYTFYERDYDGDNDTQTVEDFRNGTIDAFQCTNHIIDIGQQGIKFEYYTNMNTNVYKGDNLPADGIMVECMFMPEPAVLVEGGYNSFMKKMYSATIYYPIDAENTYRIVATWIYAGGSLGPFGANANSGNVGQGINDEFTGITNFVLDPSHF